MFFGYHVNMKALLILIAGLWDLVLVLVIIGIGLLIDRASRDASQGNPCPFGVSDIDDALFADRERHAALMRDNYTCRNCGAYPVNIAHHILPRRWGGSDYRENLMTVCRRCHMRIEPR